jgi:hypothetical protein
MRKFSAYFQATVVWLDSIGTENLLSREQEEESWVDRAIMD